MTYSPLGDSRAAAAVCSTAFFVVAVLLVRLGKATMFRLYFIMGIAATSE